MPDVHVPAPAATNRSNAITVDDVQTLLAELNIDSLMAGLDGADPAETVAPAVERTPKPELQVEAPRADVPIDQAVAEERRSARRLQVCDISGGIRLTIPGCSDIQIINISGSGVLVETARQLRPDTLTDLFVRLNGKRHAVKARAVRSTVYAVKPQVGIVYRTALHFDKQLPLEAH
jgi:hypothetical protein